MNYSSIHQRYLIITLETFHYAWRCFVVVSYLCQQIIDYERINCIDINSLTMGLIFRVVVENYRDYLMDDGIPLADWQLAQMNGEYSN